MEDRLVKGDWRIVLFGGGGGRVGDGLANMNVSQAKKKAGRMALIKAGLFFSLGAAISHCQLLQRNDTV